MASLPIFNPDVPFLGAILGGFQPGKRIIVQGVVTSDRFNINLQTGASVNPRDDAPLHISIRPKENNIVRNIFLNNAWQEEERAGGCPIAKGEPFTLDITAKDTHYSIYINGSKYCRFQHRLPLDSVNFIHLGTGADIESVIETW